MAEFLVFLRPGMDEQRVRAYGEALRASCGRRGRYTARSLRRLLLHGAAGRLGGGPGDTALRLPEPVYRLIGQTLCYEAEPGGEAWSRERIEGWLREHLSDKRFRHTLGVRDACRALAQKYGIPEEQATLAALLHDCSRYMGREEMEAYVRRYRVWVPEEADGPNLWHADHREPYSVLAVRRAGPGGPAGSLPAHHRRAAHDRALEDPVSGGHGGGEPVVPRRGGAAPPAVGGA